MHRTRVKICGITRQQDLDAAVAAGADAIGLVFNEQSPRHLEIEQAAALAASVPAFVTTVALFRDAEVDYVHAVLASVGVELLQFHGSESPDFCRRFCRPWIKALGMQGEEDIESRAGIYQDARGILLDGHAPGAAGGSGESFDWNRIPASLSQKLVLAGGLRPGNVYKAVIAARPWAVDVSSGVEVDKGIKSAQKMNEFINEVKRADGD